MTTAVATQDPDDPAWVGPLLAARNLGLTLCGIIGVGQLEGCRVGRVTWLRSADFGAYLKRVRTTSGCLGHRYDGENPV